MSSMFVATRRNRDRPDQYGIRRLTSFRVGQSQAWDPLSEPLIESNEAISPRKVLLSLMNKGVW